MEIDERIRRLKKRIKKRRKKKVKGFLFKPFSKKQKQILTWWCEDSPVKDAEGIIADGSIQVPTTLEELNG